jgi:hypothetical protein
MQFAETNLEIPVISIEKYALLYLVVFQNLIALAAARRISHAERNG